MPAAETYFIVWKGRRDGPYSLDQLVELLKRGDIGLLHRVETSAGLVPLRQLLPSSAMSIGTPDAATEASSPAPELTAPPSAPPVPAENPPQEAAMRAYTTCGWCFAWPPLARRAWAEAGELADQGYPKTARRMQLISAGLSVAGAIFWLMLGWQLFSRRW